MKRRFNITGLCVPDRHYVVDISSRLEEIRKLVEEGAYFTINRARQYGKTTTLNALAGILAEAYFVVHTSGYPYLVSAFCKLMDEEVEGDETAGNNASAWTRAGFLQAERILLTEKDTLFDSMIGKVEENPELDSMLKMLLFTGADIAYNADEPSFDRAVMFGLVKNQNGRLRIANRIFETRLYNYYLSAAEMQKTDIYKASQRDRNQFVVDGHLNMRRVMEKFTEHFSELYGSSVDSFIEDAGRRLFLLYLRPIINGVGNYYVEAQTRDLRRTDVIVDYGGEQYIIEMKIWHGNEYNSRGERQLVQYLDDYHMTKGYMLSFNFNKNKTTGVREIVIDGKILIEAVV